MLLIAGASLSALHAAGHAPLLDAVIFAAPVLLHDKPFSGPSLSRQPSMELTCSVDFHAGTMLMAGDGAAGAAAVSMRASVATAAPSSPVLRPPTAGCASAESGQHVLGLRETSVRSGAAGNASALASISSAGGTGRGDTASALPDEALHPTQLDAALHLAAVDASAALRGLRVPAAAGGFFLQRPAAKQAGVQQQVVSSAPVASGAHAGNTQEAWSTSDHQLDAGSACCVISGMLAKPLKADLSTAGLLSAMPDQHGADVLYSVEWQANAALAPPYSAERPLDSPAIPANASPVALRMRGGQGAARMAAVGVHLAAVSAAASPQRAAALTAALGLSVHPAHHHSATVAVQSGILAGIMKTLAREAISARVSTQLLDPQNAASVVVSRAAGSRLQLCVTSAGQKQSADEHGVALSGGARSTPALTRSQLSAGVGAAPLPARLHGTVIITGTFLAAAACVCAFICTVQSSHDTQVSHDPVTRHTRLVKALRSLSHGIVMCSATVRSPTHSSLCLSAGGLGALGLMVADWWAERCPVNRIVLASRSGRAAVHGTAAPQLSALCSGTAIITITSCDVSGSAEIAALDDIIRQLSPGPITVRTLATPVNVLLSLRIRH